NVGDDGALSAASGPGGGGTGFRQVALARLKNHADLMDACGNVSCSGCRASSGCGEATHRSRKSEMGGIRPAGDRGWALVAADADARSGDKLADDETVGGGGLNRGRGRSRGAATRGGKAGSTGDVGELCCGWDRNDGKRAVVAGHADARDGHGLSCGETVR